MSSTDLLSPPARRRHLDPVPLERLALGGEQLERVYVAESALRLCTCRSERFLHLPLTLAHGFAHTARKDHGGREAEQRNAEERWRDTEHRDPRACGHQTRTQRTDSVTDDKFLQTRTVGSQARLQVA